MAHLVVTVGTSQNNRNELLKWCNLAAQSPGIPAWLNGLRNDETSPGRIYDPRIWELAAGLQSDPFEPLASVFILEYKSRVIRA